MGIFPPRRETVFGVPLSSLEVGQRTEAFIVHRLMECGYTVLTPLGVHRYDLVIEDADGKFWRIQCKTGRPRNGTIEFNTRNSSIPGAKKIQRNYRGDTDYFAVYSKETGKVYLVPIGDVGTSLGYLRVEPVKNHLQKGVRWAKDYEL
jgi:hypothetical protein